MALSVRLPPRYTHPLPALPAKTDHHLDQPESRGSCLREEACSRTMTNSQVPGTGNRSRSLPQHPPLPPPWLLLPALSAPPRPPPRAPPPLPYHAYRTFQTSNTPYGLPSAYPPANQAYPGNLFTPNGQFNQYGPQPTFLAAPSSGPGQGYQAQYFNPNYSFYGFPPPTVPFISPRPFQGAPGVGQAVNLNQTAPVVPQQPSSQSAAPKRRKVNGRWQTNPLHAVRSDTENPSRIEKPQKSQTSQTPPAMADTLDIQGLSLGEKVNDGAESKEKNENKKKKKARKEVPRIMLPAPKPTQDYLDIAASEPTVVDFQQNMLVVLDLNGTLLYRPTRSRPTHFIARPFLQPFLRYLFDNFYVMVWSSAKPVNVKGMINQAFDDKQRTELTAEWARDTFGLPQSLYSQKVQVYKDLRKIWSDKDIQKHSLSLPDDRLFGQRNTVLIDDSILKAAAQPYNLLEIPEFTATDAQLKSDILREVAGYLNVLKTQDNVSSFMRRNPFYADGTWKYDWPTQDAEKAGEGAAPKELDVGGISLEDDDDDAGGIVLEEADLAEPRSRLKRYT